MPALADYADRYENIRFDRHDGVLQITLHTNGGSLVWGGHPGSIHTQLCDAFYNVARDEENKVVILTGAGDDFCVDFDRANLPPTTPDYWMTITREGKDLLTNLLEIEVPVIGAVNGPAHIHSELLVLSDIVLAAETATFRDAVHFVGRAIPGDGVQVTWMTLLGPNRGRYFLLTGEEIDAAEAQRLNVVAEVLPPDRLNARAWELARELAAKPDRLRRLTRMALTRYLRRRMQEELETGLLMEGFGLA